VKSIVGASYERLVLGTLAFFICVQFAILFVQRNWLSSWTWMAFAIANAFTITVCLVAYARARRHQQTVDVEAGELDLRFRAIAFTAAVTIVLAGIFGRQLALIPIGIMLIPLSYILRKR
jgi:hypothetical protein